MDIIRVQSHQPSIVGDSKITVLRIDPGLWELEVIGIVQTGETAGHTARDWAQKQKYAAVINAGMFEADNKTHLGYLRSHDHVYNGRVNSYRSVMAFDPREGKKVPAVRILDFDIRVVKRPGLNQWEKQTRQWSEAAVGEDREGRACYSSIHDRHSQCTI